MKLKNSANHATVLVLSSQPEFYDEIISLHTSGYTQLIIDDVDGFNK